jgi:hypothetical protein
MSMGGSVTADRLMRLLHSLVGPPLIEAVAAHRYGAAGTSRSTSATSAR